MLTQDENIVEVRLSVQYVIDNVKDFVLQVRQPENSLQQATQSALRHVVGGMTMDLGTHGRSGARIATEVRERLQNYLSMNYGTGIRVSTVNVDDSKPPTQVQAAFDDVIKAREDEERVKNEAQAYANGIVPEARGKAQRQIEEASAYREEVIANAEGEADRFSALLSEYRKAPEVTRERLYLDAVQNVLFQYQQGDGRCRGRQQHDVSAPGQAGRRQGGRWDAALRRLEINSSSNIRELTNAVTEQLRRDAERATVS